MSSGIGTDGKYDVRLKYVVIGDRGVGKTSLMRAFCGQPFVTDVPTTIGVDFSVQFMQIEGQTVKFQIWDTSGQEKFAAITRTYYHGADAILIVYDVTDPDSFQRVSRWKAEVDTMFRSASGSNIFVYCLVGAKSDDVSGIPKMISTEEGLAKAKELEIANFYEISSRDSTWTEVAKLFVETAQQWLDERERRRSQASDSGEQRPSLRRISIISGQTMALLRSKMYRSEDCSEQSDDNAVNETDASTVAKNVEKPKRSNSCCPL